VRVVGAGSGRHAHAHGHASALRQVLLEAEKEVELL